MDSSLCIKSPAAGFGEVRAISSFQSSPAAVLAPSQTKHFSADICRKFQSSNENIQEKATISRCCFACFGRAKVSSFSGIPHSGDSPGLIILTHIPLIEQQNLQYQCRERTTELSFDRMDVRALPRSGGVTNIPPIFPVLFACGYPGKDIF